MKLSWLIKNIKKQTILIISTVITTIIIFAVAIQTTHEVLRDHKLLWHSRIWKLIQEF